MSLRYFQKIPNHADNLFGMTKYPYTCYLILTTNLMAAQHFTTSDFEAKVLKSDKPVVVDFFATWCGPCMMASPIIDKLADEMGDKVVIGKLDVDEESDIAQKYGVMSIPTMIVFRDGKEVERKVGFPGEAGLKNLIESYSK